MKNPLFYTLFLCLISFAVLIAVANAQHESKKIEIQLNGAKIIADVADTDSSRIRGLLGWNSIDDGRGMLLDFSRIGEYAIHMEGMQFPIDALWLGMDGEVKLIYDNIQPNSRMIYPSMMPVRYCLELNAGFCKRHSVKIGDKVSFGLVR